MHKTTLNTLRNTVFLMSAGLIAIGCAGKSVKPGNTQPPVEVAQLQVQETAVATAQSGPEHVSEAAAAQHGEAFDAKFPYIDITQYKQPAQRVFHFAFDKSELSEQDRAILEQHARYLLENPQLIVQIHGHTDHHGPREYNEYLSKRRAETVAQVLLAQGVKESQLVIDALADAQPLNNASGPGKNRRVEIEYTELNLVSSE